MPLQKKQTTHNILLFLQNESFSYKMKVIYSESSDLAVQDFTETWQLTNASQNLGPLRTLRFFVPIVVIGASLSPVNIGTRIFSGSPVPPPTAGAASPSPRWGGPTAAAGRWASVEWSQNSGCCSQWQCSGFSQWFCQCKDVVGAKMVSMQRCCWCEAEAVGFPPGGSDFSL